MKTNSQFFSDCLRSGNKPPRPGEPNEVMPAGIMPHSTPSHIIPGFTRTNSNAAASRIKTDRKKKNGSIIRRNLKIFAFLLVTLFLVGVTGLFMGIPHLNQNYVRHKDTIEMMDKEIFRLGKELVVNKQKIEKYDFMEYKASAFGKRYPQFSLILDSIYSKSHKYGFKPELVLGIIQVESGFNPKAMSYVGACGLMQINLPVWRKELGIDDRRIFEVDYNIDLGLQILRGYYDECGGNLKRALHLYNNGYLFNNTSYTGKVDAAVRAFKPVKFKLAVTGSSLPH